MRLGGNFRAAMTAIAIAWALTGLAAAVAPEAVAGSQAVSPAEPTLTANAPEPSPGAPPSSTGETTTVGESEDRMTVPVFVNGQGPFRFLIDTGADRSAVTREVAQRVGLRPSDPIRIHALSGSSMIESAIVDELRLGESVSLRNLRAPLLSRSHLGADGILGIDSLQGRRIVMNFVTNVMRIEEASSEPVRPPAASEANEIIVVARSRLGQLIVVDADVGNQRISVVLDTGAQNTIGNPRLRQILSRQEFHGGMRDANLLDVLGAEVPAKFMVIDRARVGGVRMDHLPVAFADAHPFRRFGLVRRPALLLGMDVLRNFEEVKIDFANRRIVFDLARRRR